MTTIPEDQKRQAATPRRRRGELRPAKIDFFAIDEAPAEAKPPAPSGGLVTTDAEDPVQQHLDSPSVLQQIRSSRKAQAVIAVAVAVATAKEILSSAPGWWLGPLLGWLALFVLIAHLTTSKLKAVVGWVVSAVLAVGAAFNLNPEAERAAPAETTTGDERANAPDDGSVPLGSGPKATALHERVGWTLTRDHRLIGFELAGKFVFEKRRAPRKAVDLRICGDLLVVLTGSGRMVKLDVLSGHRRGEYDAGRVDTWSCSGRVMLLMGERGFVRLDLDEGAGQADVKVMPEGLVPDQMLARGSRVWAVDTSEPELLAWDLRTQNLRYAGAVGEGSDGVELLRGLPHILHADQNCLRPIDRATRSERVRGIPLGGDPRAIGGDGRTIVVGEGRNGVVTMVEGARPDVRRVRLPGREVQTTEVDVNDGYLVIGDARAKRLHVVRRGELGTLEALDPPRVPGC